MISRIKLRDKLEEIESSTPLRIKFYKWSEKFINSNPDYRECLMRHTSGLDSSIQDVMGYEISLYQRIYYFLSGRKEIARCNCCNKPLLFLVRYRSSDRSYLIRPFERIKTKSVDVPTTCGNMKCVNRDTMSKLSPEDKRKGIEMATLSLAEKNRPIRPITTKYQMKLYLQKIIKKYGPQKVSKIISLLPDVNKQLISFTKFLDDNKLENHPVIPIGTRINCILHNINVIPKCETCGNAMRGDAYVLRLLNPQKYKAEFCTSICSRIDTYKKYPGYATEMSRKMTEAKKELWRKMYGGN